MGKHSAERDSSKNRKKGQGVNKIIISILCISLLLGIGIYLFTTNSEREIRKTIDCFFTAIKEENKEVANQYVNYEELLCSLDDMFSEQDNNEIAQVEKELFKDIVWNIENIEVEEDKAIVVVEVTNKDFKNVITKWMKELVVSKSLEKEITNELALQKLQNVLKQEQGTKTIIKKVTLNKSDKEWKVQVDEELRDLVYPGIDSIITGLKTNESEDKQ